MRRRTVLPLLALLAVASCLITPLSVAHAEGGNSPQQKKPRDVTPADPETAPMQFRVIASPPACNGCVVINASGEVTANSSRDFALFIAETRLKGILPREPRRGQQAPPDAPRVLLAFDSIGGNVTPALVIGRRIRELGWTTIVGQARMDKGKIIFESAGCYSACSMMILGGVERLVLPRSKAGVHQFSPDFGKETSFSADEMNEIVRDYGRTVTNVYDYVADMGVDISFFVTTMRTPFSSMNVVPESDWLKLGIATRLLPDKRTLSIDELVAVGTLRTPDPVPEAKGVDAGDKAADNGLAWSVVRPESGLVFARFSDPANASVTVTCIAADSARLDLTLRHLSPVDLARVRDAALSKKRLKLGDREVEIEAIATAGDGEQGLSATLDARDLKALQAAGSSLSFAILDRSGNPATQAVEVDATGAGKAVSEMMAACGKV